MTRKTMLYYAHEAVLMRWAREIERIQENPELEMPIARYRAEKYKRELDELEAEMKSIEAGKEEE